MELAQNMAGELTQCRGGRSFKRNRFLQYCEICGQLSIMRGFCFICGDEK